MVAAVKQVVTVQADGLIEIRAPELREGMRAEVIVLLDAQPDAPQRPLGSFIGSGKGAFKSAEEVDAYIREIRDWGDRDRDPD